MSDQPTPSIAGPTAATTRRLTVYTLVITALIAAVLLRYVLDPWMGNTLPLVTVFGAVAAAVWSGGRGPAIAVVILGYLACAYLFIEPRGEFAIGGLPGLIGLFAYLVTCALIIGFGAQRESRS